MCSLVIFQNHQSPLIGLLSRKLRDELDPPGLTVALPPPPHPLPRRLLIKNWKGPRFISLGSRRVLLECYKTQSAVTCLRLSLKVAGARNLFCPCNANTAEILQPCGSTAEPQHRLPAKYCTLLSQGDPPKKRCESKINIDKNNYFSSLKVREIKHVLKKK